VIKFPARFLPQDLYSINKGDKTNTSELRESESFRVW